MIKSGHEKVCAEISHNENELLINIGNPLLVKVGNELGQVRYFNSWLENFPIIIIIFY